MFLLQTVCVRACVRACEPCVCACVRVCARAVCVFAGFSIQYVNCFDKTVLYVRVYMEYCIYDMYHVSAQGVDKRMINVHYCYYYYYYHHYYYNGLWDRFNIAALRQTGGAWLTGKWAQPIESADRCPCCECPLVCVCRGDLCLDPAESDRTSSDLMLLHVPAERL